MRKHKGIVIAAIFLVAAVAVVAGSRLIKNPVKNENKKPELPESEEASELHEISDHDFYISEIPDEIVEKTQGKS